VKTAESVPLPVDVAQSPTGTWTASLGAIRGIGATGPEALADLGRLLTTMAEHHADDAAFAIDDQTQEYIVAVPDGLGGSTQYHVDENGAAITGTSTDAPAEALRGDPRHRVVAMR